ncbi:MAG TPA: pyridoxal-dependent decarboxylase, partial [Chloroflexota bacterium]
FRALKLWFVLRSFGREGIVQRLREHIRLAQEFARWVEQSPDWEIMSPAPFSTVCFRARPPHLPEEKLDAINQQIMDYVNGRGEAFLSHTKLYGQLALRLAIGNIRTEERHVRRVWELMRGAANGLRPA